MALTLAIILAVVGLLIGLGMTFGIKVPKIVIGVIGIAAVLLLAGMWFTILGLTAATDILQFVTGYNWVIGLASGLAVGAFISEML